MTHTGRHEMVSVHRLFWLGEIVSLIPNGTAVNNVPMILDDRTDLQKAIYQANGDQTGNLVRLTAGQSTSL